QASKAGDTGSGSGAGSGLGTARRQARPSARTPVAADTPRRDDQLIAIPPSRLAPRTNPLVTSFLPCPDATVRALGGHRARERIPPRAKRRRGPARSSERLSPAPPGVGVPRSPPAALPPGPRGRPIRTANPLPQARSCVSALFCAGRLAYTTGDLG